MPESTAKWMRSVHLCHYKHGARVKKVLMVAYHFPPLTGSSGIQRTLRFVQHLPALGWQPIVLTADPRAYEKTSGDLMADVPNATPVHRAFALDTARHLQFAGRYLGWMARPDRWISWKFAAIKDGLKLIEKYQPDVIWSTFPIATAHVIASSLHRKTGIPWVADFRDPMAHVAANVSFPADPRAWQSYLAVEADAVAGACFCVFTSPGAARLYRERYPLLADRMMVVENGYDEESFSALARQSESEEYEAGPERPLLMLHSGIVYALERDPTQLFVALARLKASGTLGPTDLRIRFRASVNDALLQNLAQVHGVSDFIELCQTVTYREALTEMLAADVLLVMQSRHCNDQIPAKLYEYLRAGRPILGLTDPEGDTASVLRRAGLDRIARLDSVDEIATAIQALLFDWRQCRLAVPQPMFVQQASRQGRSQELVTLLDRAAQGRRLEVGGS